EYIKIALMNIKTNKGRSALTMLGIILGIASVIMSISIGNGVRGSVNEELENMGGGLIAIYTNSDVEGNDVSFTEEDFALIKEKVEHVKGATAQYGYYGATAKGRKGDFMAILNGGNTALQYAVGNEPIVRGRYFSDSECEAASMVCVINESSARSLFGTTDVVGMSFELSLWDVSQDVRIVGIRQDTPAGIISAMSGGVYLQVEMPLSAMASGFGFWIGEFSQLYVIADSSEYVTQVATDTINLLENRYNVRGENKIMMESFADYSAQYDQILGMLTLFISFVAAISLLVGGIGVMNIMLVSVTERTREIGIRKSLGARTKSILLQFLAEAGIITLIGGLIGIVLGALGARAVCGAMGFSAQINVSTVIIAAAFSSGVGIFFGIYPAKKAAKLSPIEALRHE
ncbi:MAG: ABC transporter permease, partial [Lachnospiraceae bacterium]|nr:ABC transporter permease [Lachnospiraceae bacterium]